MDPEQIKTGVTPSAEHTPTNIASPLNPHVNESGDLAKTQEAQKKLSELVPGAGGAAESIHTSNLQAEINPGQFEANEKKAHPSETTRGLDDFERYTQEKIAHNTQEAKPKNNPFKQVAIFFGSMFSKNEQPVQPAIQAQTTQEVVTK